MSNKNFSSVFGTLTSYNDTNIFLYKCAESQKDVTRYESASQLCIERGNFIKTRALFEYISEKY